MTNDATCIIVYETPTEYQITFAVIHLRSPLEREHPATHRKWSGLGRQTTAETTNSHWMNAAQATLKSRLGVDKNMNVAKNIIFFIGDGMSLQTSSATRVFAGGNENHDLSFDKFPYVGWSKTYAVNRQVPDSASTATAYLTGVKTNYGLVGVDSNVRRYNCEDHANEELRTKSLAHWAHEAKKATGFITTTRVTHASPAPLYAHSANRYWENDMEMAKDCDPEEWDLDDIAEQLVYNDIAKQMKIVLGGGRREFLSNTTQDEEGNSGLREDGKNLIEEWLAAHSGTREYVWNKEQLLSLDLDKTDYILGLFESDYMKYDYQAQADPLEPTLSELVEVGIKMMQKEKENGYFLFVEGGRIDTAHHSGYAKVSLDETRAFSDAIALAQQMTDPSDTLIVVSADHAHTMTYNGYPARGNNIMGISDVSINDNLPFSTLSYINGPGHVNLFGDTYGERDDVSNHDRESYNFRSYGLFPLSSESHGADDVGVYAIGPHGHLFVGAYEQNALPYMIAYAAKIGPYLKDSAVTTSLATSLILLVCGHILRNILF